MMKLEKKTKRIKNIINRPKKRLRHAGLAWKANIPRLKKPKHMVL